MAAAAPIGHPNIPTQAAQPAQKTDSLMGAIKEVGRHLAELLYKACGGHSLQSNHATQAPLNPAPPPFDTARWITGQCNALTTALNTNGHVREQHLTGIYNAAKSIRDSIPENITAFSASLPADLRADFDGNITLIQNHFTDESNTRAITVNELRFLQTYIDFLKLCVGGNGDLSKKLDEVKTALDQALNTQTEAIEKARKNVADLSTDATTATRAAANATLAALTELPEQITVNKLNNELQSLEQTRQRLNTTIENPFTPPHDLTAARASRDTCDNDIATIRGELDVAEPLLEAARTKLTALQTATNNTSTIIQAQEISTLLPGATAENFSQRALLETQKRFQDIVKMSNANKHVDLEWLKFAKHFEGQITNLQAGADITIPEGFNDKDAPQNGWTAKMLDGLSIYQRSKNILTGVTTDATPSEKKLAALVVGGFCAQEANRNGRNGLFEKSTDQMEAAGHLLYAELSQNNRPANETATQLKEALIAHAHQFELKKLEDDLKAIQSDTANASAKLESAFKLGMHVSVMKNLKKNIITPEALLKQGKTDRTYENDVTAMNGASRQKVFKEAMLCVVEILKDPTEIEGKSRVWKATQATLGRTPEDTRALLGLGDNNNRAQTRTDLLDQLALASIAQSDLSTEKYHQLRGSLIQRFNEFGQNSTIEVLKNHNLTGYEHLGNHLSKIAIQIRPSVNTKINAIKTVLEGNTRVVNGEEIDQLIKQIIITTDTKAVSDKRFNLKNLIDAANELKKSNTPANRTTIRDALTDIQQAWSNALPAQNLQPNMNPPSISQWATKDSRSTLSKALTFNPVKSLPFVNQIPVVSRLTAAAFDLARVLLGVTAAVPAGVAVGAVGSAAVVAAGPILVPAFGAYIALQRTT